MIATDPENITMIQEAGSPFKNPVHFTDEERERTRRERTRRESGQSSAAGIRPAPPPPAASARLAPSCCEVVEDYAATLGRGSGGRLGDLERRHHCRLSPRSSEIERGDGEEGRTRKKKREEKREEGEKKREKKGKRKGKNNRRRRKKKEMLRL